MTTKYTHRRSTAWTPEQWSAVEEYAEQIGMSPSVAVRVLVLQGLSKPELADMARFKKHIVSATEDSLAARAQSLQTKQGRQFAANGAAAAKKSQGDHRSMDDIVHEVYQQHGWDTTDLAIAKTFVADNQALFNDSRMDDDYQPESD